MKLGSSSLCSLEAHTSVSCQHQLGTGKQPSTWYPGHLGTCHRSCWGGGIFLLCFLEMPLCLISLARSWPLQGAAHGLQRKVKWGGALKDGEGEKVGGH